jgi:DNA-binding transcriptional regulator YiaG
MRDNRALKRPSIGNHGARIRPGETMSSFTAALRSEMQRVARKEIRAHLEVTRKATTQHRRDIAMLKRQIRALEQKNRALARTVPKTKPAAADDGAASGESRRGLRFSAKGLQSLRARLELSAVDMGRLLGVSGQSIYNWEQQKTVPRAAQVAAIAALRSRGKREVRVELDSGG